MPSNRLILCRPLLLLPPIPPSIRVFSIESTLHMRWPKYWSFSFSIVPSKEIPGLISFRMDWLDLRAVHETLKSLLQHHSSKANWCPPNGILLGGGTCLNPTSATCLFCDLWKNQGLRKWNLLKNSQLVTSDWDFFFFLFWFCDPSRIHYFKTESLLFLSFF